MRTTVKVWDLASNRQSLTFQAHSNFVSGMVVMPDRRRIVSAS